MNGRPSPAPIWKLLVSLHDKQIISLCFIEPVAEYVHYKAAARSFDPVFAGKVATRRRLWFVWHSQSHEGRDILEWPSQSNFSSAASIRKENSNIYHSAKWTGDLD